MQNRLIPATAALVAFTLAGPLFAQSSEAPDLSQVVAVVNGTEITLGHVAVAKASLPDQYRNLPADVLFPGIIDQLIQQTVLQQSFEGEPPARVTLSIENESRSLMAGEVIEGIMARPVDPEAIVAAYEAEFGSVEQGLEYSAAHILLETEEEANNIKTLIERGAQFEQMARDHSTGPSGPRGGDLGWFGTGVMVPEFEQAVTAMEAGDVSDPIQTQFGWHLIRLNDTREKAAPELETVKEEIELRLRQQSVTETIETLTNNATIDRSGGVDMEASVLDQIDLSKSQ